MTCIKLQNSYNDKINITSGIFRYVCKTLLLTGYGRLQDIVKKFCRVAIEVIFYIKDGSSKLWWTEDTATMKEEHTETSDQMKFKNFKIAINHIRLDGKQIKVENHVE